MEVVNPEYFCELVIDLATKICIKKLMILYYLYLHFLDLLGLYSWRTLRGLRILDSFA